MSCHLLDGAQSHIESSLMLEPEMPSHKCALTGEPIYKGVRIDGEEYFSIDVYESYGWVQWYKDNAGLSEGEARALRVEHFTDSGFTNTLSKTKKENYGKVAY
jgi:hypothetical protein